MRNIILVLFILIFNFSYAETKNSGADTDKKNDSEELIDFSTIKDLLEKDNLDKSANQKIEKRKKLKENQSKKNISKYNIPGDSDFWSFASELWLVKNNSILKWDFQKPDYGIEEAFKSFLEQVGKFEISFNIVLINSANITHFALPSNDNNFLLVLSVPFLRTLDLTKLQISLLLYEDILRAEAGFFKEFVMTGDTKEFIGSNFYGKKITNKSMTNILKKYDDFILDKGFSFKQQFQITKMMDRIFKSNPKYWTAYFD